MQQEAALQAEVRQLRASLEEERRARAAAQAAQQKAAAGSESQQFLEYKQAANKEITLLKAKLSMSEVANRKLQALVDSMALENKELTEISSNLLAMLEQ